MLMKISINERSIQYLVRVFWYNEAPLDRPSSIPSDQKAVRSPVDVYSGWFPPDCPRCISRV